MTELAVMGAIMLDESVLPTVERLLAPEDFTLREVRECYIAARKLRDEGTPIDEVSVHHRVSVGALFVSRLAEFCPSLATVEVHVRTLRKAAAQRRLVAVTRAIADDATIDRVGVDDAVARLNQIEREDADRRRSVKSVVKDVMMTLELRTKNQGALLGITTGYDAIDKHTSGWRKGELTVLAARPAMGKTALALNFVLNAIRANRRTIFFSLEMSAESIVSRMLAMSGVDATRIKTGRFEQADWTRMGRQASALVDGTLSIEDGGSVTIESLQAKVRSAHQVAPVHFVVVDYLQLMHSPKAGDKNREREVAEISRGLKALARDLEIPVLALSQLNRSVESRTNKRPGLADLRESGAIEQDADVVMFLYRDEVYEAETEDKGVAEVAIAKNRDGEIGVARLAWRGEFQRFDVLTGRQV